MCIIKATVNPCAVADFAEFGFTLFQSLHHAAAASVAVGHFTPGHSPRTYHALPDIFSPGQLPFQSRIFRPGC